MRTWPRGGTYRGPESRANPDASRREELVDQKFSAGGFG